MRSPHALLVLLPSLLVAQVAPKDSARADSAARLGAVTVRVTRTSETDRQSPRSVARVSGDELHRGRVAVGLDEALPAMAGVLVQNRNNYSVDQRLSIRGAGSRANFGIRGVKILLDGIPQSLPDGQNQLSNVDLASIGQVEVLRGSASSLYGNASGGVLSFSTDLSRRGPLEASTRVVAGGFGLARTEARLAGGTGPFTGALSASRMTIDGFRQHSAADVRQLNSAGDIALGGGIIASTRFAYAETPRADNPGAMTPAEYAANSDSATASNVVRGALRRISQRQASVRLHREAEQGWGWSAAVFGVRRLVDNPLATLPPGGSALSGTLSLIDRRVTGTRLDGQWRASGASSAPSLGLGLDVQRAFDVRRNYRTTRGVRSSPTDSMLVFQGEETIAIGPFVQGAWSPLGVDGPRLSGGLRHDRLHFAVTDQFLADGVDNSGARTMSATSGQFGVAWPMSRRLVWRANVSTSFESPTSTELSAREDGRGGFNDGLKPQQGRMVELGARVDWSPRLSADLALYDARAHDAIVPYANNNGRSYFRNAGGTHTRGAELDLQWRPVSWLSAHAALTWTDARFATYRVVRGAAIDTLDGNRLAGIPDMSSRVGLEARHGAWYLATDWNGAGRLFADDINALSVAGWNSFDVRASWRGQVRGLWLEPFAGVNNLGDRRYIGAVTVNATINRTLEPAAPRQWIVGLGLRHATASH